MSHRQVFLSAHCSHTLRNFQWHMWPLPVTWSFHEVSHMPVLGFYSVTEMKDQMPERCHLTKNNCNITLWTYLKELCVNVQNILKTPLHCHAKNVDNILKCIKVQIDPCTRFYASLITNRQIFKPPNLIWSEQNCWDPINEVRLHRFDLNDLNLNQCTRKSTGNCIFNGIGSNRASWIERTILLLFLLLLEICSRFNEGSR